MQRYFNGLRAEMTEMWDLINNHDEGSGRGSQYHMTWPQDFQFLEWDGSDRNIRGTYWHWRPCVTTREIGDRSWRVPLQRLTDWIISAPKYQRIVSAIIISGRYDHLFCVWQWLCGDCHVMLTKLLNNFFFNLYDAFTLNHHSADHDSCPFWYILLVDQITVIGNEICEIAIEYFGD